MFENQPVTLGIERFAKLIPQALLQESGKVFYTGRDAFSRQAALYIVGAQPGGAPENYTTEIVGAHTEAVIKQWPSDWSAFRDEVWEGAAPGTYGMAPRVLHLFRQLNLEPHTVPASNLIFVRSRNEEDLRHRQAALAELCWPFHQAVIDMLKPRVVLCLGGTAGRYMRERLGAGRLVGEFIENNNRRWRSQAFDTASGTKVVVATHPSRADWCAAPSDPSGLVRAVLATSGQTN